MHFLLSLWALLVKNAQLKKRHWVATLLEVALPIAFVLLFTLLKSLFSNEEISAGWTPSGSTTPATLYGIPTRSASSYMTTGTYLVQPSITDSLCPWLAQMAQTYNNTNSRCRDKIIRADQVIALAPEDPADAQKVQDFIDFVQLRWCDIFQNFTRVYTSSRALDEYLSSENYGKNGSPLVYMGIVFHKVFNAGDENVNWDYSIRMNSTTVAEYRGCQGSHIVSTQEEAIDYLQPALTLTTRNKYYSSGFMTMKLAVDRYIINKVDTTQASKPCSKSGVFYDQSLPFCDSFYLPQSVYEAPMPIRSYTSNAFYAGVLFVLSLMYLITFLYPLFKILSGMVEEKELKIREGLKIMGVSDTAVTASWYITYMISFGISSLFVTIVCKRGFGGSFTGIFGNADFAVIFFFFYFFGISIISFCFALSSFFNKAKVAGVVGVVVFFGCFFGYFGTSGASESTKVGLCFLSPIAFALGIESLGTFEQAGLGVTSSNIGDLRNDFRFQTAIILLIFDSIIYTIFGWYLSKVYPREWGVVEPWYFLFTKKYWFGSDKENRAIKSLEIEPKYPKGDVIEQVSSELQALEDQNRCIQINNLVKIFETPVGPKVAVNQLSMNLYEGQIFALLGHNGAGKTTLVSMLSGMLPITSGSASILGLDVENQMSEIHKIMGVCPQHDVLYPDLTVAEHLRLFGRIKGLSGDALNKQVQEKIDEVGLSPKTNARSKTLSGGQKRKLSLAIALIGDSKVVFLDEPTSGMDPHSRRFTWDLIQKHRAGKIIILTTHFMDEADMLGDRIAIMGKGELKCCGSSLFLKNRFGQGYSLTLTKTAECDETLIRKTVSQVNGAKLLNSVGKELSFQLPVSQVSKFPELLDDIDANKEKYGIDDYGISITTMEEIFIRVSRDEDHNVDNKQVRQPSMDRRTPQELAASQGGSAIKQYPSASMLTQIQAVFIKRSKIAYRDKKGVGCVIVLPLLLVIIGLAIVKYASPSYTDPSKLLDLSDYPSPNPFLMTTTSNVENFDDFSPFFSGNQISQASLNLSIANSTLWGYEYLNGIPCSKPSSGATESADCTLSPEQRNINVPSSFLSSGDDISKQIIAIAPEIANQGWYKSAYYASSIISRLNSTENKFHYFLYTNTSAAHSTPTFMNVMNNAAAKYFLGSSISVRNWPFPSSASTEAFTDTVSSFNVTIFLMIAISFIPSAFVALIVKERETTHNSKHLQLLSGCEISSYWIANWLWEIVNILPFGIGCIILIAAFDVTTYMEYGGMGIVSILFIGFCISVAPFTYFLSYFFNSASSAQNWLILFNFLTGLILTIVAMIMAIPTISSPSVIEINKSLKYVYRLFPGFCLGNGLTAISIENISAAYGSRKSFWDWDVCGADIAFLFFDAILYATLTFLNDLVRSYPTISAKLIPDPVVPVPEVEKDIDVKNEEERVFSSKNDAVRVLGLTKVYRPNKLSVRKLQFGIQKGECFGLLGVNGAGKTTTLKMLTGDVVATSGTAQLHGYDVFNELRKVRKVVGYCPQFDALNDLLNVREHLELYARLKGVPAAELNSVVDQKLEQLDLKDFEFKLAHTLSGGNKRKLSVAIALIGNPPIVFLDEPSTGMDPVARRFMWKVISEISTGSLGSTVILTTHAMEECEALCTTVGIMVAGRFRCMGNVQHLKSRFGQGFTVDVKVNHEENANGEEVETETVKNLINFFATHFPGYEIVEKNPSRISFKVPQAGLSISRVFRLIEEHKARLSIVEYSCSQTTLEQIFNYFASQEENQKSAPGLNDRNHGGVEMATKPSN